MDVIFIKDKGLLATCGLDRAVHLWGIENLAHRGSMVGHRLGVRALAYASAVLVSASLFFRATAKRNLENESTSPSTHEYFPLPVIFFRTLRSSRSAWHRCQGSSVGS